MGQMTIQEKQKSKEPMVSSVHFHCPHCGQRLGGLHEVGGYTDDAGRWLCGSVLKLDGSFRQSFNCAIAEKWLKKYHKNRRNLDPAKPDNLSLKSQII